jgi:hypothetical protein
MISKGPGGLISITVLISGMRHWNKKPIQPLFGTAVFTILLAKKENKSKPLRLRRGLTAIGTSHSF